MNLSCCRQFFTLYGAIFVLFLIAASPVFAQEAACTLSGRVVDFQGNPVAGFTVGVQSYEVVDGEKQLLGPALVARADDAGRFSITGIDPIPIRIGGTTQAKFNMGQYFEHDSEIQTIKIGAVTIHRHQFDGGISVSIKPMTHISDVEIKVKPHALIRGQVVFTNGSPLANARIQVATQYRSPDGRNTGSTSTMPMTDNLGYFAETARSPGIYTVTVNFKGLSVTAKPFQLQEGETKDDLVFTLRSDPIMPDVTPEEGVAHPPTASVSTSPLPLGAGVWVVNPANGHAYKSIHCESWDDANAQAVAEDAYLVAINDAAEQKWITMTFAMSSYWIGLTDHENEGEWKWTNGEPVTYANWAPFEPMDADTGDEDYVFMDSVSDWFDVDPENQEWQSTNLAIIERDIPPPKTHVKEK